MSNGNARTGKYQALRRRAEIVEARLEQIKSLEWRVELHHGKSLYHRREASRLQAELNGLIKLGFAEGKKNVGKK